MAGQLDVTIVTVRDIFQDEAGRKSRFSEEYKNQSAVIFLDRQDLSHLGVKEGDRLEVKNDSGSVVVVASISGDESHPGLAFMNNSPWSNQLVSDLPGQDSIPEFKGIKATVLPAEGGAGVTEISELLARMRA